MRFKGAAASSTPGCAYKVASGAAAGAKGTHIRQLAAKLVQLLLQGRVHLLITCSLRGGQRGGGGQIRQAVALAVCSRVRVISGECIRSHVCHATCLWILQSRLTFSTRTRNPESICTPGCRSGSCRSQSPCRWRSRRRCPSRSRRRCRQTACTPWPGGECSTPECILIRVQLCDKVCACVERHLAKHSRGILHSELTEFVI